MDNRQPLVDAITAHRQEFARRIDRIRRDTDATPDERTAALTRAYQQATTRHAELVTDLRATAGAAQDGEDGGEALPQGAAFMNALIRGQIGSPSAGDRLLDNIALRAPERPREVTG